MRGKDHRKAIFMCGLISETQPECGHQNRMGEGQGGCTMHEGDRADQLLVLQERAMFQLGSKLAFFPKNKPCRSKVPSHNIGGISGDNEVTGVLNPVLIVF